MKKSWGESKVLNSKKTNVFKDGIILELSSLCEGEKH